MAVSEIKTDVTHCLLAVENQTKCFENMLDLINLTYFGTQAGTQTATVSVSRLETSLVSSRREASAQDSSTEIRLQAQNSLRAAVLETNQGQEGRQGPAGEKET